MQSGVKAAQSVLKDVRAVFSLHAAQVREAKAAAKANSGAKPTAKAKADKKREAPSK